MASSSARERSIAREISVVAGRRLGTGDPADGDRQGDGRRRRESRETDPPEPLAPIDPPLGGELRLHRGPAIARGPEGREAP